MERGSFQIGSDQHRAFEICVREIGQLEIGSTETDSVKRAFARLDDSKLASERLV